MKKVVKCAIAAGAGLSGLAALASGQASAAPVTVDPDAFSDGTDISNAFAGVTLSTVFANNPAATPESTGPVFALAEPSATTGSLVFGTADSNPSWGGAFFEYLRADFDVTATSVSLDFYANTIIDGDVNAELLAFDAAGNLVDRAFVGLVAFGDPQTLTVNGDIAYVFAYWDEPGRVGGGGGLDNLVFSPVPLPGAVVFFATGLLGAAGARRLRKA